MKPFVGKRVIAAALTLCLLLALIPSLHSVEVNAVSYSSLTCADFISNGTARNYIDTMMRYYLDNNSKLRSTLDNGLSVIFMFEGGSDNYQEKGSTYTDSVDDIRNQSVVIVVQKNSAGDAYVDFWAENCSSIPGDPDWCTGEAYTGSTTILDGIYPFYTTNHTGPYAALQLDMSATNGYGYYTPSWDPDGFKNGASGINIHTRSTNIAAGASKGWAWSEGCQVISSGYTRYDNYYNEFMQSVTGITWDPWIDYPNKVLNSFAYTGEHMGYYVVDRQLGLASPDGTEYGSGSLAELYTEYALEQITAYSANARANAGFQLDYMERCTYYPSYCLIQPTHNSSINSYPCADGTNGSVNFEKADPNKLYTCTGVYQNHAGNFWWQLISSSGEVGYMYGESATFIDDMVPDLTVDGARIPTGHVQGSTFSLSGTVSTALGGLGEVSVRVCSGFDANGAQVTGGQDTADGYSYDLSGSAIDHSTAFDQLTPGKYTYVIEAKYYCYFPSENKLYYYFPSTTLLSEYFVVVSGSVSQSSCSHSYVTHTLTAADCTTEGSVVKYCELCGKLSTEIVRAYGHKFTGQTTVAATCTTDGYQHQLCSVCGYEETTVLPASGHRNQLSTTEGSCVQRAGYAYICQTCGHTDPVDLSPYQSTWSETIPEGFDEKLFATREQYRYRDEGGTWTEWYDGISLNRPDQEVQTRILYRMKAGSYGDHSWSEGSCTLCDKACKHSYQENYCTTCGYREPDGDFYLFGFINGANYACEEDAASKGSYKFVDGRLVVTFTERSYVAVKTGDNRVWYMTDGYPGDDAISARLYPTEITGEQSNKLSVPKGREITFTLFQNVDGSLTLWYVASECEHDWLEGVCQVCDHVCEHMVWTDGACSSCHQVCQHSWLEGICSLCALQCKHDYQDGVCTVCLMEEPATEYYLFGFINGRDYGCESDYQTMGEYLFIDGQLTVTFGTDSYVAVKTTGNRSWYMTQQWLGTDVTGATLYNTTTGAYEKLFVPGGQTVTFHLTVNEDDTLELYYDIAPCPHAGHTAQGVCVLCGLQVGHRWSETVTEASCLVPGFIIRTCLHCGQLESQRIPAQGHQMIHTVTPPTCLLAGFTTHTCTVCGFSYSDTQVQPQGHTDVAIYAQKPTCTTEGSTRYQCKVCGYQHTKIEPASHTYEPNVIAPTCTQAGFTAYLCACGDGYIGGVTAALGHQYTAGSCTLCGAEDPDYQPNVTVPTLTLKSPSLEFKDMIRINAFFTAENLQDVVQMGMITYSTQVTAVSIETAEHVIPGATYVESSGRYFASSQGIHAKYLGDTVYLAIYAQLSDGSYTYTKLVSYSPVQYATGQLKNSADLQLKQLCAAMLSYAAEAQLYFGHNTDALANSTLTVEQKALPEAYRPDMVQSVPTVPTDKQGIFANNSGFSKRSPAVSFEDAFCINYFFTPKYTPDSGITLYYWNAEDYSANSVLSTTNATGYFKLEGSGAGEYRGDITGIAAKELSEAVYVAAAYKSGGTVWTSGVLGYSIGAYCAGQASKGGSIADLAMATAVYGYHAKQYFG